MAPKPSATKPTAAGKKPTGALSSKGKIADAKSSDAPTTGDDSPTTMAAPKNKEEVLAQVNLDGLPDCPTDAIIEILRGKYETLVAIFVNYCKLSDCKTMETSTRLRLGVCCRCCPLNMLLYPQRIARAKARVIAWSVAGCRSSLGVVPLRTRHTVPRSYRLFRVRRLLCSRCLPLVSSRPSTGSVARPRCRRLGGAGLTTLHAARALSVRPGSSSARGLHCAPRPRVRCDCC